MSKLNVIIDVVQSEHSPSLITLPSQSSKTTAGSSS